MKSQVMSQDYIPEVRKFKNAPPAFETIQQKAIELGGSCLSIASDYENNRSKLLWQCKHGHEWLSPWGSVQSGKWCPTCAGILPPTLDDLRAKAAEHGGLCLAIKGEYKNNQTKLSWQCRDGHQWQAEWATVQQGRFCPHCYNKSEAMVRRFLEVILGFELPLTTPMWLRFDIDGKKKRYQLDGLNEVEKVAFEYHGNQHYFANKHWHQPGEKTLQDQQDRDAFVRLMCAERNIKLIEIQYILAPVTVDRIIEKCVPLVETQLGLTVDAARIQSYRDMPFAKTKLEVMQEHAISKGGLCLATEYIKAATIYPFQCGEGHQWETTWTSVKKGSWCQKCAGLGSPTFEMIQARVEALGWTLLAKPEDYVNYQSPLRVRCANNHEWGATWQHTLNSKRKRGCPTCAKRTPPTLLDMQRKAIIRGGLCLAKEGDYKKSTTFLPWRCREGHEWSMNWNSVQQDVWCPTCANKLRGVRKALWMKVNVDVSSI